MEDGPVYAIFGIFIAALVFIFIFAVIQIVNGGPSVTYSCPGQSAIYSSPGPNNTTIISCP